MLAVNDYLLKRAPPFSHSVGLSDVGGPELDIDAI